MRKLLYVIGLLLLFGLSTPAADAQEPVRDYVLLGKVEKLPANLDELAAAAGGAVAYTVPEIGMAVLTSANPDFQAQMEAYAEVESVSPDVQVNYEMPEVMPQTMPPWSGSPLDFAQFQWNLDAIDAPEAWAQGATGAGVRIAIVDDGLLADYLDMDSILDYHPDLSPNLNIGLSKSFIPGDPNPFTPMNFPSHSSYVAGIAAAADNGDGIIGVAPEAEIVGVRVLQWVSDPSSPIGYSSEGKFSWLAAGIVYAAKIDSDVINISLGGWVDKNGDCPKKSNDDCLTAKDVKKVRRLLDRATRYAHKKGSVVIAAAGNDGIDADANNQRYFLPAQSDKVISVSATGPIGWFFDPLAVDLDTFAFYSNFGNNLVDLAAPGGNPTLLFQHSECLNPSEDDIAQCFAFTTDLVPGPSSLPPYFFTYAWGTSAAAPHVSGVAALIIGQNGGSMNPDLVEQALKDGADDLGAAGTDSLYGHGRVNAVASLNAMSEMDTEGKKEKEKKQKQAEGTRTAVSDCASATVDCVSAGQHILFLGIISNR